jgi:AcrR family transcriptional regulator
VIAVNERKPGAKRPYRMRARAKAAAETNERILDATEAIFDELPFDQLTLAQVAERAGVSVQTVIRLHQGRQGLIDAAVLRMATEINSSRALAPVGDVAGAIGVLVDHYDEFGDRILLMFANENRHPSLRAIADGGHAYHQAWCEQVFAPGLKGLRGARRERRVAQLAAVTDIYFWKLLRRDRGLSGRQTKLAMRELLEPLI